MNSKDSDQSADMSAAQDPPPSGSIIHGPDLLVTAVILVLCGVLYYVTTTFDPVSSVLGVTIGPEWFPRILLGFIAILALTLPIEHLYVSGGKRRLDADRNKSIHIMTVATAILLALTVFSVPYIGTYLAAVAVCTILPILWGERRWQVLLPYIVLFPLAVTLVFTKILRVYFEPGIFGIQF